MMLKKEVIASNVSVKVHLHKALEFRNEPEEHINADKTLMNRNIGNATNESEITFEYKIKTAEELKQIEGFSIDDFKEIPFQTIIEYTKLNGMKCIVLNNLFLSHFIISYIIFINNIKNLYNIIPF